MFVKWKATATIKWVNCLLVASFVFVPIARGLSTVDERDARKLFGGYRITPKFCRASKTLPASDPRSRGPTICMFNHECAQRNGEVVGACMDGFLFGACCQIPGEIEDSLLHLAQKPQISSNSAAALSYESYGGQQSVTGIKNRPSVNAQHTKNEYHGPTGSYYETESDLENEATHGGYVQNNNVVPEEQKLEQFYVNHNSVLISSPSSTVSSIESGSLSNEQNYSPEIPAHISTQQFSTNYEETVHTSRPTQSMNSHKSPPLFDQEGEFSHSDITHPGAESVLIEENQQPSSGYGQSIFNVPSPTPEMSSSSMTTASSYNEHTSPMKPTFKPKPTVQTEPQIQNQENYVLVQTITKDKNPFKPQIEGITTSDIESIESIILMLNDTNHGPPYNINNASPNPDRVVYTSIPTSKPTPSPSMIASDKYGNSGFYITTIPPSLDVEVTTAKPITTTTKETFSSPQSTTYQGLSVSSPYPSTSSFTPTRPVTHTRPSILVFSSTTSRPSAHYGFSSTSQKPSRPSKPVKPSQNNEVVITPTKRPSIIRPTSVPQQPSYSFVSVPTKPSPTFFTKRPGSAYTVLGTKVPKLPSTSYVTGPTTPRPRPTPALFSSSSSISNLNTIDQDFSLTSKPVHSSTYGPSHSYGSSTQKVPLQQAPPSKPQRPQFVKIPATQRPPSPTIIITPKPTSTAATSSPWAKLPPVTSSSTSENYPTSSYIITSSSRPDPINNTYPVMMPVDSNDFDDHGYFDEIETGPPLDQLTTEGVLTPRPDNDRPAFSGYYGPTPTYSTFNVPVAPENDGIPEEETYTSPNDFVNFPPVRNPNLNMSATSSAVTYDLDMSTPAFVEDDVLKDKMNMLVNKIVQSLQGNFNVLADIIEERNSTIYQDVDRPTARPPTPTRRPVTTKAPQTKPTKISQTLSPTKHQPSKRPAPPTRPSTPIRGTTPRPSGTRKPTVATKKPTATKRPPPKPSTVVTKKPPNGQTTRRPTKPPKRVSTTTVIYDEEETPDVEENEVESSSAVTEGSRRFQCGVRPHVKSGRIVGGKGATFGEWPWQVLVRESTWLGLFTKNKCGGVLITNKFVVTAAHCQPGFLASLVAVFGEFDISGDLEAKRSVTKNVRRVIVHRQYDAATFENDLALLELESAIHYDTHIVPICMPPDTADFTGRMATVTGWGRLKYGGGVPSVLQEVQVPIIENSVCQEMFHTAGHNKKILPSFLCAGYANGQKDSCEGDSGGPLVLQRDDGRWELAGTVSHGIKCAAPYLPGVYMRTTFYKPWLKSITGIK